MPKISPQGPSLDQVSSFELGRPVNEMEGFLPAFGMAAYSLAQSDIEMTSLSSVQYVGDIDPHVTLVTAEEMLAFHESQGLEIERATRGMFKSYLDRNFPNILPETSEVPALPYNFNFLNDKRVGERRGPRVIVSLAAGRHSLKERRTMQGMVHRFYKREESNEAIAEAWPTDNQDRGYPIFSVPQETEIGRTAVALIHRVFERQPEIVPATLACGALQVVRRGVERPKKA